MNKSKELEDEEEARCLELRCLWQMPLNHLSCALQRLVRTGSTFGILPNSSRTSWVFLIFSDCQSLSSGETENRINQIATKPNKCPYKTISNGSCLVMTSFFKRSWFWLASVALRASTDADRCAVRGMTWLWGTSGRARAREIFSKWGWRKFGLLRRFSLKRRYLMLSG